MPNQIFAFWFLLYYPLKQGLKHCIFSIFRGNIIKFLLYYPLKQGLKHNTPARQGGGIFVFLLYYPLKQGLKHEESVNLISSDGCFYSTIH